MSSFDTGQRVCLVKGAYKRLCMFKPSHATRCRHTRAFTLVELVIVIAIVGLLMGVLFPALSATLASARGFKCQTSLRGVAFDFTVFADDQLHGSRGNDALDLPKGSFRIETFQNAQYGIDEFWSYGSASSVNLPDAQGRDPMRCAAVRGDLTLRRNIPCSQGGVSPAQNVSYTFNMRLHLSDSRAAARMTPGVVLTSQITSGNKDASPANIPLVWDVDGAQAKRVGTSPVFSAPSAGSTNLFAGGRFWYPGMRHLSALNIAFIDGHVDSTVRPLEEPNWAWGFDPAR